MAQDARRDRRIVTAALVAVVGLVSCCGCAGTLRNLLDRPHADLAVVARPVEVVEVERGDGAVTRSFTGTARAGDQARLSFNVPGLLQEIAVEVGDVVVAGQPIAKLDPTDLALQVRQLDASFVQADAFARTAQATLDRIRSLYAEQNASQADLDGARAAADGAAARASAARKQRDLAAVQLGHTTLEAGRAGAVVEVLANTGENVAAGQPVVVLASGDRPEVAFGVPGSLIGRVSAGMPAEATFGALAERRFAATVTEVGVASAGAVAYPVTVTLDAPAPEVKPGMAGTVTVRFPAPEGRATVRVPLAAVAADPAGTHVWVVEDDTVHRRAVRTGDLGSDGVEIVEGLAAGDRVVTAGASRVRERDRVRVVSP